MKISEAASLSGLSVDTIRYYEKEGILSALPRGADGNRRFTPMTVEWLTLLASLRATGMPLKTMQKFAALYLCGDKTMPERKVILQTHAEHLKHRAAELQRCADLLAYKIGRYDELIGD